MSKSILHQLNFSGDEAAGSNRLRLPTIPEPISRTVYSELGLAELFARTATDNGLSAELVFLEDLAERVRQIVFETGSQTVQLDSSPLLQKVELARQLAEMDVTVVAEPDEKTPTVKTCLFAVAETGTVVCAVGEGVRAAGGGVGAGVGSTCMVVVEPKNFLADLIDLMDAVRGIDVAMTSGPSLLRVLVLN